MGDRVTIRKSLKSELEKMRRLAKNSAGGHANTFWVGYDQAAFELQKRFGFLELSTPGEVKEV